jgi:hypothetical protein
MTTFTDRQMEQIDVAAARRVQDDEWRDAKPTKHAGLHPLFADILRAHGMPQSDQPIDPQPTEQVPA